MIPMSSGTKGYSLFNSHNSFGYSKATLRTQPFEIFLLYLYLNQNL